MNLSLPVKLKSPGEWGFNKWQVALFLIGLLAMTNGAIGLSQITHAWPAQVLAFIGIMMVPGAALLRLMRIKPNSVLETIVYAAGMSTLVLIVSGLATNQLLQLFWARPLELPGIWAMWNIGVLGCIGIALLTNNALLKVRFGSPAQVAGRTWLLVVAVAVLPLLAAGGAVRLNNGGDAVVACAALLYATALVVYIFIARKYLHDTTLAWCIFMFAISILLMTSLRSWDIAGHDLAREFRVYTLTHTKGLWDISAYRDPYNACLSITILPEMFAKVLNVSGLVSFKLLLQIVFALCPVVMYIMLRRYVSKLGALVGCVLFISYPTFINDSAMLTRQGVAYLFFSLALLTAMDSRHIKVHRWLFLFCGIGVVLSHYSTSYMFVAIFGVALVCKLAIQRMRGWRIHLKGDNFTVLTPAILIVLATGTFLWYSHFTATSGGLGTTIATSMSNIPHLLSDDNKSSDTSAALLMASRKSQTDIYEAYLAEPVLGRPATQSLSPLYEPQLAADDIAVTPLGGTLHTVGARPAVTNDLRQQFAKVLQLLAAVSVIYTAYFTIFQATYSLSRKKKPFVLPLDLIALSMAGIVLLILMVVLPNLSLNYGVLRTFQQSLIFLVIPLCVSLTLLGRALRPRVRTLGATAGMAALFLLFTGLFAQAFGGVGAALTLNNHGLYYGLYYTTKADLRAYAWMKAEIDPRSDVRAASFARAVMHDPEYPFKTEGIMPTQTTTDSYIFLDQAQVKARRFYVYQDGSPLITTFPLNYYNDRENQIYSTTTTAVYH